MCVCVGVCVFLFQPELSSAANRPSFLFHPPQEKVLRMLYVWALCRDPEELNPYAAWRLLDISTSSTEQIL